MANAIGNNGGRLYSFGSQPILIDCNFVVDSSNGNGLGTRSLKGQGVKNVYMYTSATPARGVGQTIVNPMGQNASKGYVLIQLKSNYNRYLGGFSGFVSPPTGSALAINTTALTVGKPYTIASVGTGPAGTVTIAPVQDSSGSLAGTYFTLYDSYGNQFVIWFYVTSVGGSQPQLGPAVLPGQRGLQYVQQTIAENASASTIGTALAATINLLPSGINGVYSFTATGTTTVTAVSTANLPVAGVPQDGSGVIPSQGPAVPIIFTISSGSATSGSVWTDGLGHLYTVTATVSSGTTLHTSGIGIPNNGSAGTLTFVSGSGATTTLSFSAAVAGFATGFTFSQTVSDTMLGDWQGVGLPVGLTPALNQSFIATATGYGNSTGTVYAAGVSGCYSFEVIGDPNQSIAPMPVGYSAYPGGWILVQILAPTSASVTTAIPTAPANNSVIGMNFYMDAKFSPSNIGL